jgi:hypothetical protein
VKLGLDDKRKTTWAVVLGVVAILAAAYEFIPMFTQSSPPQTSAEAAAPGPTSIGLRTRGKAAKKLHVENLDPTLRLDLLAAVEQTEYQGNQRNIFVSQAAPVDIPQPKGSGRTDEAKAPAWAPPPVPQAPPIPLKFYGFASEPGEPKKIFLSLGEDVFVAGEGEIVNRRYKVIRISATSVEIQDMVFSGPPQSIPLTPG